MHVVLIAAQEGGAGKPTLAAHFEALAERDGWAASEVDARWTAVTQIARTFSRQP